jgi:hypothetical protein
MKKQSLNINITKTKQIIHSYIPLLFLFLFPHGFEAILASMGYIVFAGYFYLKKIENKAPTDTYEYYFINLLVTLFLLSGYANGL